MGVKDWLAMGLDAIGIGVGANSAKDANRTNIKLQREQQGWEEMMANTAIQRRADDIQKAGGNRALAFTGGGEAATPSVAPARVEPSVRPSDFNFTAKAMALSQVKNMEANTRLTNASASAQETKNLFLWHNEDLRSQLLATARDIKAEEWHKIQEETKGQILRNLGQGLQNQGTALANQQTERMMNTLIETAVTQLKAQKLDLAALENIASIGGIEAQKAQGFVNTVLGAIKSFMIKRN